MRWAIISGLVMGLSLSVLAAERPVTGDANNRAIAALIHRLMASSQPTSPTSCDFKVV